jgi:hypothetical protein
LRGRGAVLDTTLCVRHHFREKDAEELNDIERGALATLYTYMPR